MKSAEQWIKELQLEPHPEGGYFKQTDLSDKTYTKEGRPLPLYTNIYFLLTAANPSHFHRLTSDELWFYHAGHPLSHTRGFASGNNVKLGDEQRSSVTPYRSRGHCFRFYRRRRLCAGELYGCSRFRFFGLSIVHKEGSFGNFSRTSTDNK